MAQSLMGEVHKMALRIQLRRDLASNWIINNPILLPGEIGIETDTLKFKIGNGARWNATSSYAFRVGQPNGVATLGTTGKLTTSQIPDSFSINADIQDAFNALTTSSISEGTNKYYTDARAIQANADIIAQAIANEIIARNAQIDSVKTETLEIAAIDATNKANEAKDDAILESAQAASLADNLAIEAAVSSAADYTDQEITKEITNRNSAISTAVGTETTNRINAISTEVNNRNSAITSAINALTTTDIEEGTNKYFTEARAKSAVASDIQTALAGATFSLNDKSTDDLSEGSNNLYFTNARAVAANTNALTDIIIATNQTIDDLSTYISSNYVSQSSLNNTLDGNYVEESSRNAQLGFAGLDINSKISDNVIPNEIARKTYVDQKVADLVSSAPGTLDTLAELAASLQSDQSSITSLTTLIGQKSPIASPTFTGTVTIPTLAITTTATGITKSMVGLSNVDNTSDSNKPVSSATATALGLKAPINSPSFTGTVSFTGANSVNFTGVSVSGLGTNASLPPQSGNDGKYLITDGINASWSDITLSDYLTTATASSTYLAISDAASSYLLKSDATSTYLTLADAASTYVAQNDLSNSLGDYVLEANRNLPLGFAGLDNSGYILTSVIEDLSITNAKLNKSYITVNGSNINLGDSVTTKTYSNFNNDAAANRIGYGTEASANVTSPIAGDIYIQY